MLVYRLVTMPRLEVDAYLSSAVNGGKHGAGCCHPRYHVGATGAVGRLGTGLFGFWHWGLLFNSV